MIEQKCGWKCFGRLVKSRVYSFLGVYHLNWTYHSKYLENSNDKSIYNISM